MSLSSGIDQNNPDPDYRGKFYPDLIPFNHPLGQQGLGSVLQVSNSAFIPNTTTAQDATDFATLGCVKIETGTVGMGNQPALVIGEPGDLLQIKGATLLGSLLAGNGVNTETLPLGTNGYVLTADSSAGVGVKWASAGGAGVASITAGSNIGVNNAIPTAPVVSVLNPLTSTLNLGTQSITGSTSNITLSSGTNQANMNGNLGFTSSVQATPTTKATLFNNSISVETNTNKVQMTPTYLLKTLGSGSFQVGTIGSAPLLLQGSGGVADGIQITQTAGVPTTLTTNLSNVKYYPDTVITNNDSSTVAVPLPQTTYQRLTLTNLGLTNTNSWGNYGGAIFSGFSAVAVDVNGNVWLADITGNGNIVVADSTISTILHNISTSAGGGSVNINVMKQIGGYMYIGGNFQTINGNATPQYGITRVDTSSYVEDLIFDGAGFVFGVQVGAEVYCMEEVGSNIVIGGNFTTLSNGATANYIATISGLGSGSGSQSYAEFAGGVGAKVYAVYHDNSTNFTFVGGDFTSVNITGGAIGLVYCAYYDNTTASWLNVAGNNINAPVSIIKGVVSYSQIWVGGSFGAVGGVGQQYNTYVDPFTPSAVWTDTGLTLSQPPLYKQAFYQQSIGTLGVINGADFYTSSALGTWTSLGSYGGSGNVSGVSYFSGDWKVVLEGDNFVRTHSTLPHSCIFTGTFKYDNISYGNYTITTRNVSQQFIGDDANSFWSIIGQGVGAFS